MTIDLSVFKDYSWEVTPEDWNRMLAAYYKFKAETGPHFSMNKDDASYLVNAGAAFLGILAKHDVIKPQESWPKEI